MGTERFAVSATPHFASLMDPFDPSCPIRRQVVPTDHEFLVQPGDMEDPCGEDEKSVVDGVVHRYPDRVLLLALDSAPPTRCCTAAAGDRVTRALPPRVKTILSYLREHTEVRRDAFSGGDPR
jgi:lysine 2,3-aminomutase